MRKNRIDRKIVQRRNLSILYYYIINRYSFSTLAIYLSKYLKVIVEETAFFTPHVLPIITLMEVIE